jgi:hypothetical protein
VKALRTNVRPQQEERRPYGEQEAVDEAKDSILASSHPESGHSTEAGDDASRPPRTSTIPRGYPESEHRDREHHRGAEDGDHTSHARRQIRRVPGHRRRMVREPEADGGPERSPRPRTGRVGAAYPARGSRQILSRQ